MANYDQDGDREVAQWLSELWGDDQFMIRRQRGLTGSYTIACYRVTRNGEEMFLKQYNPLQQNGTSNEVGHYDNHEHYGNPPMMPMLIARFPHGSNEDTLIGGILIPYYHEEFHPQSPFELLAGILNLATIFKAFSEKGLIYFDLKRDALRLDQTGGLHLVDFTDLITPEDLIRVRGRDLPVGNFESLAVPPEGRRYHDYSQRKFTSRKVKMKIKNRILAEMKPEPYHVYSLAGLALEILDVDNPKDAQKKLFSMSGADSQGAFSKRDQQKITTLIRRMRVKAVGRRASLDETRHVLWQILKPHLSSATAGSEIERARKLLRTFTPGADSLSGDIHLTLGDYWR